MEKHFFMPVVERREMHQPTSYRLYESNIENKYLRRILRRVFDYMVRKDFLGIAPNPIEHNNSARKFVLDIDRLDEQICGVENAIESIYFNRVDTIICGADVMKKVMSADPYAVGQFNYRMNMESRHGAVRLAGEAGPVREPIKYHNLNVVMIPWFEGFVLCKMGNN